MKEGDRSWKVRAKPVSAEEVYKELGDPSTWPADNLKVERDRHSRRRGHQECRAIHWHDGISDCPCLMTCESCFGSVPQKTLDLEASVREEARSGI